MGLGDRADELKGKVKAAVGDITDNRKLEAEGKLEEASAKAKQKVEGVADAVRDAADSTKTDSV